MSVNIWDNSYEEKAQYLQILLMTMNDDDGNDTVLEYEVNENNHRYTWRLL